MSERGLRIGELSERLKLPVGEPLRLLRTPPREHRAARTA